MGIYAFAKKAYKSSIKNNIFYIVSIAASIIVIFNAINISFNGLIYDTTGGSVTIAYYPPTYGGVEPIVVENTFTYSYLQKENLVLLLFLSAFFAVYCNINSIKRKSKEIAFIVSNGCSLTDVSRFLLYVNGMSYLYGTILGVTLGALSIPIFNTIMYKLMGISGPLFTISAQGLSILAFYVIIQIVILVILNAGFSHRNEVVDLMKVENTLTFKDKRNIRTPGIIFFILFLIPFGISLYGTNYSGVDNATYVGTLVGIIGLYGVAKYFIPRVFDYLKKCKFMYKGNRRIYVCNFLYTLRGSVVYFIGMIICLNFFSKTIVEYRDISVIVSNSLFCLVGASIIFTCTFIYNLLIDSIDKTYIYKQLSILGYDKKEVTSIIVKENLLNYVLGICLPMSLFVCAVIKYIASGAYSLILGFGIIGVVIIPLLIGGVISNVSNKNMVLKNIYKTN